MPIGLRLAPPHVPEFRPVDVALGGPRHQRRALGLRWRAKAAPLHRGLDLRPPGGRGFYHFAGNARDFKPPVSAADSKDGISAVGRALEGIVLFPIVRLPSSFGSS